MERKVLGIYGSPRRDGNSELLLDRCLEGAQKKGAQVKSLHAAALKVGSCQACGGCDSTGQCVFSDDMDEVYPLLEEAQAIVLATPVFFYSPPAQVKALIDRSQAMWAKRRLQKTAAERKTYTSGLGYLIGVGATRGKNLFEGTELVAKYFYDALDMDYCGGIFFRKIDDKAAIQQHPTALDQAFDLGQAIAAGQCAQSLT